MSRLANASLFIVVVVLLFHFAGLLEGQPSGAGYILNNLGVTNPENFNTSVFWITIVAIGTIAVAGIVVGGYLSKSFDLAFFAGATVPLLAIMVLIGLDLILIFNVLRQTSHMFAVMIVSPLLFFYGLSLYDWARGRDTS